MDNNLLTELINESNKVVDDCKNGTITISKSILDLLIKMESTIQLLYKEKEQVIENATNIVLTGPCNRHMEESIMNFNEVHEKIRGKCLLCVIEELDNYKQGIVK